MEMLPYTVPQDHEGDEELSRIIKIYSQTKPDIDPNNQEERERIIEDLDDQETRVAINEDGEVIGVMSYYHPRQSDHLYLSGIAVDAEYQGSRTVGVAMMTHLVDEARREGLKAIEAETLPRSRSFYARLGAVPLDGDRIRLELDDFNSKMKPKN